MPQFGSWKPIHDTHAIQLAAVTVTLNEPVGDLTLRKALDHVAPVATELGLTEHATFNLTLPPELQHLISAPAPVQGRSFARRQHDRHAETLTFNKDSLRYEDYEYVRWAPFKSRARKLLGDAVAQFTGVSSLNNISSEYTDVFIGLAGEESDVSQVVDRKSPLVASGCFQSRDSWHCHTGWFEHIDAHCRRLINVNIDVADNRMDGNTFRQVRIKTQIFDQFGQDGYEELLDHVGWERLALHLDTSHLRLKALLKDILNPQAAEAISLS